MLGRQPVVDRDHDRVRADRVTTCHAVVGIQVADRPPATVDEDDHGQGCIAIGGRPVNPDRNRTAGSVDHAVLTAHLRMYVATGYIAEPLARFLDASLGCQLKRDRFHYLQQDGVDGRFFLSD